MTVIVPEIESSLTEEEGIRLAELAAAKVVLELGAWQGLSTVCMAQTAERVYSVDWHRGDPHAGDTPTLVPYLQNLQRYGLLGGQVIVIVGRFEDVLPALAPAFFDLIFLDGLHTYEAVSRDIVFALPLLKSDGVLAFHDYGVTASSHGGGAFGVTEAVDERFTVADLVGTLAIVKGAA